jgi:hypothetical protein
MGPRKSIQTCIDFAILLCENPRKRRLLRGNGEGGGSPRSLRRWRFLNRHTMDLFQYQGKSAEPQIAGQIAYQVGLRLD